ncbi:MAG: hypothetical protein ABIL76_06020 [candidate division WOR-3 bacterium]
MTEVSFSPGYQEFKINDVSPIPTTETIIFEILPTDSEGSHKLQKHTQFSIRGNCILGSLTSVVLRIYWLNKETASQLSVMNVSVDKIFLNPAQIILSNGTFSFTGGIEPTLGIRITIQGTGTNTGSSLTNAYFAVRTN